MTDTNQLPQLPNTSKLFEDDNNIVIGYTADQMRAYALQARAQVRGEPSWWMRETDEGVEWTDAAPLAISGWIPLYTTPQPAQATQPAEVTDEQIAACVKRASTYGLPFVGLLNPGGTPSDFSKRFTAEILALRPVQVPLTGSYGDDEHGWTFAIGRELEAQEKRLMSMLVKAFGSRHPAIDDMAHLILTRPAHHGITAQAKKETP